MIGSTSSQIETGHAAVQGEKVLLEAFDGMCEGIGLVGGEWVERIPEPSLSHEFECGTAHPHEEVYLDLLASFATVTTHASLDRVRQLRRMRC